jgi:hypothetical protein
VGHTSELDNILLTSVATDMLAYAVYVSGVDPDGEIYRRLRILP